MRIGLIADIHGNTVALDAVIAELGALDLVVCLGDIAAGGPDPAGAVDRIAELDGVTVQGNTDAGMVDMPAWWRDPSLIGLPDSAKPGMETCVWGAGQLTADHRSYLEALPLTTQIDIAGIGLLAFHGSPRSYDDFMAASTPDDELRDMLDGTSHPLVAGGHTHVPLVRRVGTQTLVNPGSVGMPFAEYGFAGGVAVLSRADYAVVTHDGEDLAVELHSVPVDPGALESAVRSSDMPHADWWLALRGLR